MKFDWVYMFGNSATCGTDYNINTSGCNGSEAVELQEVAYFSTTLYFPPSICLIIISDFYWVDLYSFWIHEDMSKN